MSHTYEALVNNQCYFPVISAKAPALAHPGSVPGSSWGSCQLWGRGGTSSPQNTLARKGGSSLQENPVGTGWSCQKLGGKDWAAKGLLSPAERPMPPDSPRSVALEFSSVKCQESSVLRGYRSCPVDLRAGPSAPSNPPLLSSLVEATALPLNPQGSKNQGETGNIPHPQLSHNKP